MSPASSSSAPAPFDTALRSVDPLAQNSGVEEAVALGPAAVPALLGLLRAPEAAHAQIMFALAEIADARARAAFVAGANDVDEAVRAQAARGLARLGDPTALDACLRSLNDAPDLLHLDITPAVEALGAMGLAAVPGLLERMADTDELTRLRARRALERVLARRHGLTPGRGAPTPDAEAALRAEWRTNGDYDHRAPAAQREAALRRWHGWLGRQEPQR